MTHKLQTLASSFNRQQHRHRRVLAKNRRMWVLKRCQIFHKVV